MNVSMFCRKWGGEFLKWHIGKWVLITNTSQITENKQITMCSMIAWISLPLILFSPSLSRLGISLTSPLVSSQAQDQLTWWLNHLKDIKKTYKYVEMVVQVLLRYYYWHSYLLELQLQERFEWISRYTFHSCALVSPVDKIRIVGHPA